MRAAREQARASLQRSRSSAPRWVLACPLRWRTWRTSAVSARLAIKGWVATLAGVVVAGVLFGVAVDLTDEPIDIDQQPLRAGIPTVAEFDAWRQRELRLATVEGDDAMQAPSTVRFASVIAAGRTRSCTSAIRSRIWPSGWNVGVWSDPGDLFLMGLFVAGSSASRASSSGGHRRCR